MLHMEVYPALPTEAASIRKEVFMEEQGFVEEFDEIDHQARHIVVFNGEVPVGTCRFYWDQERNSYVLGRVAVRKAFRGQSLGLMLVQECERQVIASKANKLFLAAQVRVKEFYEKQGYTAIGREFLEEYCPHIWMYKTLS
ncbi:GNAT family N-acetyltransferase [Pseudoflavonifractor sp. AF19-9AC]|nr:MULTISPECIES: GNAT family N-acetyltransferase [unclassified Flavonifractor]OUN02742.1 GNAT family N-acetyltransferase [Flavonifractor sp. An92]OUQ23011.1 GNAT family N-acetyltransferase [Flavonifractor sp. An135]RHR10528.1 GNAT family N-acetyltransferase [Pseudoflavonifractor sp. AF19-9AC]